MKKRFGGSYRRGARPEKHQDAAGGLIRAILITLDDLKITEKSSKGGRKISRVGQQALDLVAGQVCTQTNMKHILRWILFSIKLDYSYLVFNIFIVNWRR